jgi:PQQ-like domain
MTRVRGVALVLLCVLALSGCDWAFNGFDARNTRFNAFDGPIGSANAGTLVKRWSASLGSVSGVRVARGQIFASSGFSIFAFDEAGRSGCAGTPKRCSPIRTYPPSGPNPVSSQAFSISGSTLFAWDSNTDGANTWPEDLTAFDAAGLSSCDAVAHACTPLRRYDTPRQDTYNPPLTSPVVESGVLYVIGTSNTNSTAYAFDAAGVRNCSGSPVVCQPLWRGAIPGAKSGTDLAVADGRLYASSSSGLTVFNVAGLPNCPLYVCSPLWRSAPVAGEQFSSPAVANGFVYQADGAGTLRAFDSAGINGCTGSVCAPVWTAPVDTPFPAYGPLSISVGPDTVTMNTATDLRTFDARGVARCSGTPKTCRPLWTAPIDNAPFNVIIGINTTNGLAVASESPSSGQGVHIYDVAGSVNCTVDALCSPLWSLPSSLRSNAPAIIANGQLIAPVTDDQFQVYGLP